MLADRFADRLEPALDPAIERVVVAALVMRLVRLPDDPPGTGAKADEAAAAITPAIGHVGIDPEIVPASRKTIPSGEPRLFQHRAHLRGPHQRKTAVGD